MCRQEYELDPADDDYGTGDWSLIEQRTRALISWASTNTTTVHQVFWIKATLSAELAEMCQDPIARNNYAYEALRDLVEQLEYPYLQNVQWIDERIEEYVMRLRLKFAQS